MSFQFVSFVLSVRPSFLSSFLPARPPAPTPAPPPPRPPACLPAFSFLFFLVFLYFFLAVFLSSDLLVYLHSSLTIYLNLSISPSVHSHLLSCPSNQSHQPTRISYLSEHIYPSILASVNLPVYLFCLSISLSVCLRVSAPLCLSTRSAFRITVIGET